MSLELPEGLTWRHPTTDDVPTIVELIAAGEEHDDGVVEVDPEDVVMALGRFGFDPAADAVLVLDGDPLVGWANVYRGRAEAEVRPSHRGRGVGSSLLAWTEGRARALGHANLDQVRTAADASARALFGSRGYRRRWESWILRIELDQPISPPIVPAGVAIRVYDPARDERSVHRIWEDAMSALRGREPEPFDVWASESIAHASFAPRLSRVAFVGERPVGTLLAYDFADAGEVWIGQVATVASHRGRGIASALLLEVFAAAREAGRKRCGLSTDSDSGARTVYERNGMRVVRTYVRYTTRL